MALFYRRYLCMFAFLFILVSFLASSCDIAVKVITLVLALALLVISIVFTAIFKKNRFKFLVGSIGILFIVIALFNSLIFISIPTENAQKYFGEQNIEAVILEERYSTRSSSSYNVRLKKIGEEKTNIKAELHFDDYTDLLYGDTVVAVADISKASNVDKSVLITAQVENKYTASYKSAQINSYFSIDGIKAICSKAKTAFTNYVDSLYGEDSGLIKGVLISDKTDIQDKTVMDFRRAGASHLLAVSGLHITLLLGSLELLLRKLKISKKPRCVVISVIGLVLLALTGFSSSAVRSVLMLYMVYLSFILYEDNDAITSLFVAIFIIVLFSPYSIYDIGMWMSFLATLGLVTVYPYLTNRFSGVKAKKKTLNFFLKLSIWVLKTLLITIVANFFLLPIMWYFFGYVSLASIPANLALSNIVLIYLPISAVSLVVGKIPFIGEALIFLSKFLGKLIINIVHAFASIKLVSLKYPFASVLVILFVIAMTILIIINLKRKIWILLPPLAFVVAFIICLSIFSAKAQPNAVYAKNNGNEFAIYEYASTVNVCDINITNNSAYMILIENISPYVTEIESYTVSKAEKNHSYNLKKLFEEIYVRELRLPASEDEKELEFLREIFAVAQEYDVKVTVYHR